MNRFFRNAAVCCLFALPLLVHGCATTLSPAAANIKDASKETVSGCKYLGEVTGSSKVGSQVALATHSGKVRAREEALEKAAQLGGTHIVWYQFVDGYPAFARGDVYSCVGTAK